MKIAQHSFTQNMLQEPSCLNLLMKELTAITAQLKAPKQ
jgi:hypothetical protein